MRIYVSASSIKKTIRTAGLPLNDLPRFIRGHGFEGLELTDEQVSISDRADLQSFRQSCIKADCGLIIDINSDLTYSDRKLLQQEVSHVKRMLHTGNELGAKCLRIFLGGQSFSIQNLRKKKHATSAHNDRKTLPGATHRSLLNALVLNRWVLRLAHVVRKNMQSRVRNLEGKMKRAVVSLEQIMPAVVHCKIPLAIENHWGISGRPENIIRVIEEIESEWLGTCPDFGNFPRNVDPYKSLKALGPYALHAHAKSYRFDKYGEVKEIDYKRCLSILQESGYEGDFTVEYEGGGNDLQGCLRTRDLILKYW